jgi:hypothetical protein
VENTGGGVLYQDNTSKGLAAALEPMLADPVRAHRLGQQGREGVVWHYDITQTAEQMISLSQRICTRRNP